MVATLIGIIDLAESGQFARKVRAAMVKAAIAVAAEPSDTTPKSTLRRSLSVNVFVDLDGYTRRFAVAVAALPTITVQSVDADVDAAVSSVWNAIAGAPPA